MHHKRYVFLSQPLIRSVLPVSSSFPPNISSTSDLINDPSLLISTSHYKKSSLALDLFPTMPRAKKQKTDDTMAHAWTDLPSQLESAIPKANQLAAQDENLKYFTTSEAITGSSTFGIKASGSDNAILTTVSNGKVEIRTGNSKDGEFTLVALPEQWEQFFKQTPKMPYQSFWGKF